MGLDLESYLQKGEPKVAKRVFGEGDLAFEVELKLCNRTDLDSIRRRTFRAQLDEATRSMVERPQLDKLLDVLATECIVGWSGLTFRKAAALCNRTIPNGDMSAQADVEVTFENVDPATGKRSRPNVLTMLRQARGRVGLNVTSFQEWVWDQITDLAPVAERLEGDAKNG